MDGILRLDIPVLTGLGYAAATNVLALLSPETLHEGDGSEHHAFKIRSSRCKVALVSNAGVKFFRSSFIVYPVPVLVQTPVSAVMTA
ncbi:hypothetical protein AA309_26480 [Microvirga vignae]|uniref:Uncharacterized protein n=1 Tax=Microvirga vignae TaxID=1225564 RepID=A0A0H1R5C2_9HYPH|nr:hypothetical protein AA309_26480 [Microvirga vignae]